METITTHGARCGVGALCAARELPAATYYRSAQRRAAAPQAVIAARPVPARALAPAERQQVLDVLFAVLRLTVAGGALVVVVVLGLAGARLPLASCWPSSGRCGCGWSACWSSTSSSPTWRPGR